MIKKYVIYIYYIYIYIYSYHDLNDIDRRLFMLQGSSHLSYSVVH